MEKTKMKLRRFKSMLKQKGLTTVEYAVGGALITLAVVGAFTGLGNAVLGVITQITGAITGA
jgi:Flp pilus assembly pilin Flp